MESELKNFCLFYFLIKKQKQFLLRYLNGFTAECAALSLLIRLNGAHPPVSVSHFHQYDHNHLDNIFTNYLYMYTFYLFDCTFDSSVSLIDGFKGIAFSYIFACNRSTSIENITTLNKQHIEYKVQQYLAIRRLFVYIFCWLHNS